MKCLGSILWYLLLPTFPLVYFDICCSCYIVYSEIAASGESLKVRERSSKSIFNLKKKLDKVIILGTILTCVCSVKSNS